MNTINKFYDKTMMVIPPPPPRFTLNEWYLSNRVRFRNIHDQQQLADKMFEEIDRNIDYVKEVNVMNKLNVERKMKEKINTIEFTNNDILKQRKEIILEINNLSVFNERIADAMTHAEKNGRLVCQKCVIFREGRLGVDLCYDDVERELYKELEVIESCQNLLRRLSEQVNEQTRRLRATIYFIDRDLEDKDNVLKIEDRNQILTDRSLNLSMYHGFTPLDPATITAEEWEVYTLENIARSAKEINSACSLRIYAEIVIKQAIEDLRNQHHAVNAAFRRRIEELKEVKMKLEVNHREIQRQINELMHKIVQLEKTLGESERFMALSHTRLGNRCQRPGMELCKDLVETFLVNEVREQRDNLYILQQSLAEAQSSLRYLMKTQIQIIEDINVKTNSLKIDEVDCMTIRQTTDYHFY